MCEKIKAEGERERDNVVGFRCVSEADVNGEVWCENSLFVELWKRT